MTWSAGKGANIGFAMAATVLIATAGLTYRNIHIVAKNESLVVQTHMVIERLRYVQASLVDAETGQRGYLLTGETRYLEAYEAAVGAIHDHLNRLKTLTADNPAQQRRLAELQEKTDYRLATLKEGIAVRDAGGLEAASQFIQYGRGKQQMADVHQIIAGMESEELGLLAVREAESTASFRTATGTVAVTTSLGLCLVAAAYTLAVREVTARQQVAESLERAKNELEHRVAERTADLAAANTALRRSNSELEQFASVASHDLQEPLRKIQAFGDRLQTKYAEGLGEQGREYVERMQSSAVRMRNLIDALLSFSRVTSKAQEFVPVDLGAAMQEVLSDLEARLQIGGGRVEVGDLPIVHADPLQMRQLLQNLVGNALKFHKAGQPPVVRVEGRMLDHTERNGDARPQCEISVSDNGIGFEEIYVDKIFDVFQRLHGRQEYEGTGMGLAICRKIVERHGGTITARSSPGAGTTFIVTLPVEQTKPEEA